MCFGGSPPPAPPAPPAPEPPQAAKVPDIADYTRSKRKPGAGAMAGGTVLTGPAGVAANTLSVSRPSLLGQ